MSVPLTDTPDYQIIPAALTSNEAESLFRELNATLPWNFEFRSRKMASVGIAYNASGIVFENCDMPDLLRPVIELIEQHFQFRANSCLINYYYSGQSMIGFHSDSLEQFQDESGIAIVSLGAERPLTFRHKTELEWRIPVLLPVGSLFYMTQKTQHNWFHGLKKSHVTRPRMSLTFRKLKDSSAS